MCTHPKGEAFISLISAGDPYFIPKVNHHKIHLVFMARLLYNCNSSVPSRGKNVQISRVVGGSCDPSSVALAKEDVATETAAFGIARKEHVHAGRDTREAG